MPLLKTAREIRVVSILGDKAGLEKADTQDLEGHLTRHGITAVIETEDVRGRSAGSALMDYAQRHDAGLLVMGAFGHSRLRDFILGGATRTLLADPPVSILLSH